MPRTIEQEVWDKMYRLIAAEDPRKQLQSPTGEPSRLAELRKSAEAKEKAQNPTFSLKEALKIKNSHFLLVESPNGPPRPIRLDELLPHACSLLINCTSAPDRDSVSSLAAPPPINPPALDEKDRQLMLANDSFNDWPKAEGRLLKDAKFVNDKPDDEDTQNEQANDAPLNKLIPPPPPPAAASPLEVAAIDLGIYLRDLQISMDDEERTLITEYAFRAYYMVRVDPYSIPNTRRFEEITRLLLERQTKLQIAGYIGCGIVLLIAAAILIAASFGAATPLVAALGVIGLKLTTAAFGLTKASTLLASGLTLGGGVANGFASKSLLKCSFFRMKHRPVYQDIIAFGAEVLAEKQKKNQITPW